MYSVELYGRVRRARHVDGMSARAAGRYFGIDRKTVSKILKHSVPPGYRREGPPARPKLDPFVGIIDQILEADIAAGRVDIVVVYKVDRLTRSLADFAKPVETFDATGASFVSVTQAFDTATSMGRLTLNMLLSFAQFEREVTAERIRDTSRAHATGPSAPEKAASKRKGMWMGGPAPLGYDAVDRKLVIDEAGAKTIRHIHARYLTLGTIRTLKVELDRDGIVSKQRTSKTGRQIGGRSFTRGALALILRNPLYIGEVRHNSERYPGQALIKLTANARDWMRRLHNGEVASIRALARELDLDHRHVTRALPLAFLAPDIIRAILDGRQPAELTVTSLKRLDPLPMRWDDQRTALGIPSTAEDPSPIPNPPSRRNIPGVGSREIAF